MKKRKIKLHGLRKYWPHLTHAQAEAERQKLQDKQGNVCAICKRPPKEKRLCVDHNHRTGKVRGLLCFFCNKFRVGRHDYKSALAVLKYLEVENE